MKPIIRGVIIAAAIILAYTYLFCFPQEASTAVTDGLQLCGTVVLPSLFPFFVLTNCVVSTGLIDRIAARIFPNHTGIAAFLLGLLGGYPLGAKALVASVQEDSLSPDFAASLLPYCNNAGAALFLSMLGGKLFHSVKLGAMLYGIHILAALIIQSCVQPFRTPQEQKLKPAGGSIHFVPAVHDAAASALTVSAFIIVFSVISRATAQVFSNCPLLSLLLTGTLELARGCSAAACTDYLIAQRAALCSLFAGWGGLCVHAQTAAIFGSDRFPTAQYLTVKALHGITAFVLTLILFSPLRLHMAIAIFFIFIRKNCYGKTHLNAL